MESISKKIIVVVIIAAMFVQIFGFCNVSRGYIYGDWTFISNTEYNGIHTQVSRMDWNYQLSAEWMKETEENLLAYCESGAGGWDDDYDFHVTVEETIMYKYKYTLTRYKPTTAHTLYKRYSNRQEALNVCASLRRDGTCEYAGKQAQVTSVELKQSKSELNKTVWDVYVNVVYQKAEKENKTTLWTTQSFQDTVSPNVYENSTLINTEKMYRYTSTITYRKKDTSNTETQGEEGTTEQTTPNGLANPSNPSQPSSSNNTSTVVNPTQPSDTNTTDVIDNTALNSAIKFVNQLYQIKNANSETLAVKDLVDKKISAIQLTGIVLRDLYTNKNLSKEEFNKEAYKRAFGREPNAEDDDFMKSNDEYKIINRICFSNEIVTYCMENNLYYEPYIPILLQEPETKEHAEEFLKKEYMAILDREPSEKEIQEMLSDEYSYRVTGTSIVSAIFNSAEFKNKKLDDGEYMQKLAKAINLGIDLTEKQLNEYKERLASGESRNDLLKELLLHSKFRNLCETYDIPMGSYAPSKVTTTTELAKEFTANVYNSILGKDVEKVESMAKILTEGKKTPAEFIKMFVDSSNFADRVEKEKLSDSDYVKAIFKAVFQREPSKEELSTHLNKLDKNNKGLVMVDMVNSKEFASICNKYYLPHSELNVNSNNQTSNTETADYKGATIEKKTIIRDNGTVEEIITAIHFDTSSGIKGDVNGDTKVNALDAALVLMNVAVQGANGTLPSNDEVKIADVNEDGIVNASDAALILIYSAEVGANGTADWEDILKKD